MRALRLLALLLIALLGAAVPRALAASPARHSDAVMEPVTVKITTTGSTVWGKVKAHYTVSGTRVTKSCSKAKCTLHAPQGVTLHVKQTPTDSSTWPFQNWTITSGSKSKKVPASSTSFKVKGKSTVKAVYVLESSSSGSSSSGSGSGSSPGDPYP